MGRKKVKVYLDTNIYNRPFSEAKASLRSAKILSNWKRLNLNRVCV